MGRDMWVTFNHRAKGRFQKTCTLERRSCDPASAAAKKQMVACDARIMI
jgi:hypothetical protein